MCLPTQDHGEERKDIKNQVYYILGNPIRRNLVKHWKEYKFKGYNSVYFISRRLKIPTYRDRLCDYSVYFIFCRLKIPTYRDRLCGNDIFKRLL
jgi:hypothetical protein